MFKHYGDFDGVPADQHPGQPIHSDPAFDVWREVSAVFLITDAGERKEFATLAAAIAHGKAAALPPVDPATSDPSPDSPSTNPRTP